ncbi:MAG: PAS domain-containing protein [Betaproteobacteria bacterium]
MPHELEVSTPDLAKAIVDQAGEAVIFAARDGTIRLWNRGAESIFGYAATEVLGTSLDVIIPERLRKAHWEAFDRAVNSGATKYGDRVLTTRSMRKNGDKLYVDLSFGLVKASDGSVLGAYAIGRDCTARYEAERALRARVAEFDRQPGDSR